MKKAILNGKKCDNSPFCPAKRSCPQSAIFQEKEGLFARVTAIETQKCTGCGLCVSACPHGAIALGR